MTLEELEQELESALDGYRFISNHNIENFHLMDQADREHMLPQILDEMNREAFYVFSDFKENIIEYLKQVKE